MANYVLVDAEQLDADLTSVADRIRAKGGTSAQLAFPSGFNSAVDAISTGVTVQRKSGTFTTQSGAATVNCGFQPDIFYFTTGDSDDGYLMTGCFAFAETTNTKLNTTTWDSDDNIIDCFATRRSTGVSLSMKTYDDSWNESNYNATFSYVAVKYT